MKKYQVFGGPYKYYWLGEADTLLGAKRIAETHNEDLDNREGWHGIEIYDAADCVEVLGIIGSIPNPARRATSVYNRINGMWEDIERRKKSGHRKRRVKMTQSERRDLMEQADQAKQFDVSVTKYEYK